MFVYPWISALKTKTKFAPKNVATGRMSNLKSYESIMAFVAMQNCWQVKAIKVLPRSSFFLFFFSLDNFKFDCFGLGIFTRVAEIDWHSIGN